LSHFISLRTMYVLLCFFFTHREPGNQCVNPCPDNKSGKSSYCVSESWGYILYHIPLSAKVCPRSYVGVFPFWLLFWGSFGHILRGNFLSSMFTGKWPWATDLQPPCVSTSFVVWHLVRISIRILWPGRNGEDLWGHPVHP
jgi:hypothetical protein